LQNRWKATAVAIVMAVVTIAAGCGTPASSTNNTTQGNTPVNLNLPKDPAYTGQTVATFNSGEITKQELDDQYDLQVVLPGMASRESKSDFLNNYVVWYKYLYQKAVASAQTPVNQSQAKQTADESIQGLVGQEYKTKQDVQSKLKSLNLSEDDLVRLAEKGQILQQYLQSQLKHVTVSDKDAKAYYDAHQSDFVQVTVDQILLSSEQKAKQMEQQLKAGSDFAKLADENSIDPSVKQNHGHFANSLASQFVPEFAKACETLPIGQISNPVQTQYGYHVLKVDERTQMTYSQVADQIKIQLLPQVQRQKEQALYNSAQKDAAIQLTVKATDL
jgi:foldase protein PrsA